MNWSATFALVSLLSCCWQQGSSFTAPTDLSSSSLGCLPVAGVSCRQGQGQGHPRPFVSSKTVLYNNRNNHQKKKKTGWSVADDWESLSGENPSNRRVDSADVFNQDYAAIAASRILPDDGETTSSSSVAASTDDEQQQKQRELEEDEWIRNAIEDIQVPFSAEPLYDTLSTNVLLHHRSSSAEETTTTTRKEEVVGNEIAMLIRCNESPQTLLEMEGRTLPELSEVQKYNVSQLVLWKESSQKWVSTPFFQQAVRTLFEQHAVVVASTTKAASKTQEETTTTTTTNTKMMMDATGVAAWISQSLQERPPPGKYDSRVVTTVSKYSVYPTGLISSERFQQLYLDAVTGTTSTTTTSRSSDGRNTQKTKPSRTTNTSSRTNNPTTTTWRQLERQRSKHVRGVFRDLQNHGILSPVQQEWQEQKKALDEQKKEEQSSTSATSSSAQQPPLLLQQDHNDPSFVDECEIVDWEPPSSSSSSSSTNHHHQETSQTTTSTSSATESNQKYIRKSSHEKVPLALDQKTPLFMADGEFVYIDEESCIGCKQCVNTAPDSFLMLENGRARAFDQRKAPDVAMGIAACPVSCMHMVSYQELKNLETVRDKGDGRTDHRHLGHQKHTPLHVSRRESDRNHQSSWYHYLQNKCHVSSQCPQRGCFDCPSFSRTGQNPYFQKRLKEAYHVRAQHFVQNGQAEPWRKYADI